jgi:hypothetical protein
MSALGQKQTCAAQKGMSAQVMTLARTYRLWDIKQTAMGSVARLARSRRNAKRDRVLDRGFHLFWKHCRFVPLHPVIRLAVPLLCW